MSHVIGAGPGGQGSQTSKRKKKKIWECRRGVPSFSTDSRGFMGGRGGRVPNFEKKIQCKTPGGGGYMRAQPTILQ